MYIIDRLKNYKLRYREKLNNLCHHQLMRLVRMFFTSALRSVNNGVLKVMMNLTYECQCRCDYCWCGSYAKQLHKELSSSELIMILDQIARLPSLSTLVSFIGGEPLLREDIYQLINYATRKGLFAEMETNGILLSRANVMKMKEAGLNHIFVRVEGSDKEKHDSISKAGGCFERAVEGIRNCAKEKLSCSIFMNATKAKIRKGEPAKIIDLAKKLKVISVRIIYPTLSGKWLNEEKQKLSPEEEAQVRQLLEPDFVYLESTYACTEGSGRICPSWLRKFFHISCYGEVQPCPFVPISFGNLREKGLNEILNKMLKHKIFDGDYAGCPMNNADFRNRYVLPELSGTPYNNIIL